MSRTLHLLLVDDDEVDRLATQRHLAHSGLEVAVEEACDGRSALARLERNSYDCILLDHQLPDQDGLAVLQHIKQADSLTPPVIMLTGYGGEGLAVELMKAGAGDYIPKGELSSERLGAAVRSSVQLYERQKEVEQTQEALRASEERFRQLAENIREVFWMTGSDGRDIFYVSPAYEDIWGRPLRNLEANSGEWIDAIHPEDRPAIIKAFQEKVPNGGYEEEYRVVQPTGTERWIRDLRFPIRDEEGRVAHVVGVAEDITDRKRSQQALAEERHLLRTVIDNLPQQVFAKDLESRFIISNAAHAKELGASSPEAMLGKTNHNFFPSEVARSHCDEDRAVVASGKPLLNREEGAVGKEGVQRWFLTNKVPLRDSQGQIVGVVGIRQDITERKTAEQELRHNALHDALTKLPNRVLFLDRLEGALRRRKRPVDDRFAVLFLDLDHFKTVNDSLGHVAGDELLVTMARRLEGCLREGDSVARLGGDEFAILLDGIKHDSDTMYVATRIHEAVAQPLTLQGREIFLTASIGIVLVSGSNQSPEELLRNADTAMYRAKARGRACYEVFDESMHASAVTLLQLQNDLRRAFERNEFRVHYQPIVSLASRRLEGLEALVRWQRSDGQLVSPAEFIPLAEETGLIIDLDRWVLREACRETHAWGLHLDSPIKLSVNFSGKQFQEPGLIEAIDSILSETKFDVRRLAIEITESAYMEDPESTAVVLEQLKMRQLHIHIDDFGVGYSSLSYLCRFPIDAVKIDRSFISTIETNPGNLEVVRAIVALAHSLGKTVIAEGLETPEQVARLSELGCDYAQGYFFAKPMEALAVERLLLAEDREELPSGV